MDRFPYLSGMSSLRRKPISLEYNAMWNLINSAGGIKTVSQYDDIYYDMFLYHKKILIFQIIAEETKATVLDNFEELCMQVSGLAARQYSRGDLGYSSGSNIRIKINRRVMNLLTSIKTFLDYLVGDSKRLFEATGEHATLKNLCSKKYDTNPLYRIGNDLRNYIQHCGLAGLNFGWSSQQIDRSEKITTFRFNPQIDKQHLLENESYFRKTKRDIGAMPDQIPLLPILRSYTSDVMQIHHEFSMEIDSKLKWIVTECSQMIKMANLNPNDWTSLDLVECDVREPRREWVPAEACSRLKEFSEINGFCQSFGEINDVSLVDPKFVKWLNERREK